MRMPNNETALFNHFTKFMHFVQLKRISLFHQFNQ